MADFTRWYNIAVLVTAQFGVPLVGAVIIGVWIVRKLRHRRDHETK